MPCHAPRLRFSMVDGISVPGGGWARHVTAQMPDSFQTPCGRRSAWLTGSLLVRPSGVVVVVAVRSRSWWLLLSRVAPPSSSVRSDRQLVFSVFGAGGFGLIVRPRQ
jgi:hypothetical protein